jgi:nucleoside-diphosphate-sugar epimerase
VENHRQELHVIFGSGALGLAVARTLVAQGNKSVRIVNTRGQAKYAPASVEIVKGNAYSADETAALTRGAAVVYQCAAPAYYRWVDKFEALQAAILEGAAISGARLVIGDNLYMYGETPGPLHEQLPYAATTRKGRLRAKMANEALAADKAGKLRVAIGRGSDFFGPAALVSAIGGRAIYPALAGGTAQLIGNLDLPHTCTFIDDFGAALVELGASDRACGLAWHVPNDSPTITQRQLMTLIFEEIGHPPQMATMSHLAQGLLSPFIPALRELKEMRYTVEQPFIVNSERYERNFKLQATPIREAVRRTVAWFKAHPQK